MNIDLIDAAASGMYSETDVKAFERERRRFASRVDRCLDATDLQTVVDNWVGYLRHELYETLEARSNMPDLLRLVEAAEAALAEQLEREPETEADLQAFQAAVSAAGRPDPDWARNIDLDDVARLQRCMAEQLGRPSDWQPAVEWATSEGCDGLLETLLDAFEYLGFSLTSQQEVAYRWLTGEWAWQAQPAYPRSVTRKVCTELLTLHLGARPSYDLDAEGLTRLVAWYREQPGRPAVTSDSRTLTLRPSGGALNPVPGRPARVSVIRPRNGVAVTRGKGRR